MIHLELQPEIEAQLAAEAQARGLALDRHIALIVESSAAEASSAEDLQLQQDLEKGLREISAGDNFSLTNKNKCCIILRDTVLSQQCGKAVYPGGANR